MDEEVKAEEACVTIDGIRTCVVRVGTGPPIVLVHGLGGPLMWQRIVEPLSREYEVLVVHLPGFGESECPTNHFSTKQYAQFLSRLLSVSGVVRCTLIGISYGGQVAASVAALYPDRVERLVLICSTGLNGTMRLSTNGFVWKPISALVEQTILRSRFLMCWFGARSFFRIETRPEDLCEKFFHQISAPGKRNAWMNCFRNSFSEQDEMRQSLKQLHVPTLIVWGKNDRTIPAKYAAGFKSLIHGSDVVIIPECAHSVPLEKPKELCGAITKFIASGLGATPPRHEIEFNN